jgi:hypothetical protein
MECSHTHCLSEHSSHLAELLHALDGKRVDDSVDVCEDEPSTVLRLPI